MFFLERYEPKEERGHAVYLRAFIRNPLKFGPIICEREETNYTCIFCNKSKFIEREIRILLKKVVVTTRSFYCRSCKATPTLKDVFDRQWVGKDAQQSELRATDVL